MKLVFTIGFMPPAIGLDGSFNTIRVGTAYQKKLKVGDTVLLMDERQKAIFGTAEVTDLVVAPLEELCMVHGRNNHTEIYSPGEDSGERVFSLIQKLYGPQIAKAERKSCAIYLRRTDRWPNLQ